MARQRTKPRGENMGETSRTGTAGRMQTPASGAKVRMYRHGHGDCFLLAFRGEREKPVYVLIDCGYKPGSNTNYGLSDIGRIVESIKEATGGHLDLVVITHEHQDHVNGFWKKNDPYFGDFKVGAAWFAWTEDPADDLANELRERYHDQLLGLVAARNHLAAAGGGVALLDDLLSLELGVQAGEFSLEAAKKKEDPSSSVNKQGMKLIKDKAGKKNTKYIRPHEGILQIPGVDGVKVYAFGPPHDAKILSDEDPQGSEAFPGHAVQARASFFGAARALDAPAGAAAIQPFSRRFTIPMAEAFTHPQYGSFFSSNYGPPVPSQLDTGRESASVAAWRRIDKDWLFSAEDLALVLNKGINNTSLVLAFELEQSKKVLLFIGDAQRGNWVSWTKGSWKDGDRTVTVRDLMARTVLYKVGHHGSHNATLKGAADSPYPNLAWMGHGKHANEFTAMITAVPDWAYHVPDPIWRHPLASIKKALRDKCAGRVLQIDMKQLEPPDHLDGDWDEFVQRVHVDPNGLFFELDVRDQ